MSEALVSGPALPSVGFDGRDLPAPERFDSFHDAAAPIFDARPLDGPTDFHSVTRNYLADGVLVSRLRNDPYIIRRDRRHLSDGSTDWISIQLFLGGMASGVVWNDRDLRLDDGSIGIVDLARPYTASISRSDLIAVCIPRDRIAAADTLYRTSPSVTWTLDSSRGRMLADAVRRLWWSLGQAREVDGPLLADGIIESLDQVLRPGDLAPDSGDVRVQAERFIEDNLADPDLDARSVGAAVGYSRSALYRFFDDDGGVHRYIRSRRLKRCLVELTRPSDTTRRVVSVATRWGFYDASHFNRLFKAEFGIPPSVVRPLGRDTHAKPEWPSWMTDDLHRLHAWERSA